MDASSRGGQIDAALGEVVVVPDEDEGQVEMVNFVAGEGDAAPITPQDHYDQGMRLLGEANEASGDNATMSHLMGATVHMLAFLGRQLQEGDEQAGAQADRVRESIQRLSPPGSGKRPPNWYRPDAQPDGSPSDT